MGFGFQNVIEIGIEARDNASRVLDETDRRLKKTGESMDNMSRLSIAAGAAMGTALATIGWEAVRVAERIAMIPDATAEATNRLSEMRRALGVAEQDLARVKYAAESNGVGFESAANAVYFMNRALQDNPDAFKRIGLDAAEEQAKGTTQALLDVVDVLSRLDVEARASAAQDIFGRGAREIGPFLAMSRADLAEFFRVADQSGTTPSELLIALSKAYDDVKDQSHATAEGVKNAMSERVIPGLITWHEWLDKIMQAYGFIAQHTPVFMGGTPIPTSTAPSGYLHGPLTPSLQYRQGPGYGYDVPPIPDAVVNPVYGYEAYAMNRRAQEAAALQQRDWAWRYEGVTPNPNQYDSAIGPMSGADETAQAWMRRDWAWLGGTASMTGLTDADKAMMDSEETTRRLTEAQQFVADSAGQAASALVYAASGARDFGEALRQTLLSMAAQGAARGVSSLVGGIIKGVAGVGAAVAGGPVGAAAGAIASAPAGPTQIVVPLEKHISQTDRVSNAYEIRRATELLQNSRITS